MATQKPQAEVCRGTAQRRQEWPPFNLNAHGVLQHKAGLKVPCGLRDCPQQAESTANKQLSYSILTSFKSFDGLCGGLLLKQYLSLDDL